MKLKCEKNKLSVVDPDFLTSGSHGINIVEFDFDDAWDGYGKYAVFMSETASYEVPVVNNECGIPNGILTDEGSLHVGVYGLKDDCKISTQVVAVGQIWRGTPPASSPEPPPPSVYDEIMERFNECVKIASSAEASISAANKAAATANEKAALAQEKANLANEKAIIAQGAADDAYKATLDAVAAKRNTDTATENANKATTAANAAADMAENAAKTAVEATEGAEKAAKSVAAKAENYESRLSNLESAVTGKITETATFTDKISAKGRTLPKNTLPYARLNRIGGITKATSVKENGITTWTDTPSDIKYIRTRGRNQGGVIKDVTSNPFFVKLVVKRPDDDEYYDYSSYLACTLAEDEKLNLFAHGFDLYLEKDTKIRITIKSSTVDGATFVGGALEKVPVITNSSGSVYVFENAKDYLYVYPPTQNENNYLIGNAAVRIYGDNHDYVGDITSKGYNAGKTWTPKNPNETENWRIAEYYYEATVKEDLVSELDWTIPLGVFGYDPTENMSAEQKQAFNPQTDYNKYSLPSDYYRPYEESITALPEISKPLHGFDKNYSNWLTFNEDGTVDYTDNYIKYVCNASDYSNGRFFFDGYWGITTTAGEVGWAAITALPDMYWHHMTPTMFILESHLTEDEMQELLSKNIGAFTSRTTQSVNGETITTEKVSENYSPYIPVYENGIIQFLDSEKQPTDGIIDITYQTKITEA